jgi:hypothetical protein
MRRWILWLAMGAAVLGVAALLASRTGDEAGGFPPSPSPSMTAQAPDPPESLGSRPIPPAPSPALPPEAEAEARLPADVAESVARYRAAEDREEREEILLELAFTEDPASLRFLLDELDRADAKSLEGVLFAIVQYGSRDAIPRLRELAGQASSPERARRLTEAADYLELPSLTEVRRELQER